MFDIEINYNTGNSFGSEQRTEPLDNPVSTLAMAKDNLQRIKEHYAECSDNPNFDKKYTLVLATDHGDREITPFWIGYFEELHGARIVNENRDDDMAFEIY